MPGVKAITYRKGPRVRSSSVNSALVALVAAYGCAAADADTYGFEVAIGRAARHAILSDLEPCTDARLERVAGIGYTLLSVLASDGRVHELPWKYDVAGTGSERLAWACPGGSIIVGRGLVDECESDDELAFVIAHEIAHVVLGHTTGAAVRSAVAALIAAATPEWLAVEGRHGSGCHRRALEQEFAADAYAVTCLTNAGYAPQAGLTCLERLLAEQVEVADGAGEASGPCRGTAERLARLESLLPGPDEPE